jgi:hypothetical protein
MGHRYFLKSEALRPALKAIGRKKQLKGWPREKKIAFLKKMNPRWEDLAEQKCFSRDSPSRELPDAAWSDIYSRDSFGCVFQRFFAYDDENGQDSVGSPA